MKFPRPYVLKEIAELIEAKFIGPSDFEVLGMNEIHVVENGDIVFVDHPKYYDKALNSAATTILMNKEVHCPEGKTLLISEDPFKDFNRLGQIFNSFKPADSAISMTAEIGKGTVIQPNVFIGNNVKIGENCLIHPNVSVYDHCVIGDNVTIHAGTVLGGDAFYYNKRDGQWNKFMSIGRVIIEDHVEIGSGCTIDKGVTGDTTIKKGTKLDNQIQVGHDTVIGERCLIASQCGIAGCVIIEDEVTLWGQVGVISGITIGKGAVIYAQSGIGKTLEGGKTYLGSPAEEARAAFKQLAMVKQIPEILKKFREI